MRRGGSCLFIALIAGCSGSGGDPEIDAAADAAADARTDAGIDASFATVLPPEAVNGPSARFPNACVPKACDVGPTFSSSMEVATFLDGATWPRYPNYANLTTGCLSATADLVFSGDVTIADVPVPAWCQSSTSCRKEVQFRLIDAPPGVECLDAKCHGLLVHGATVRFRTLGHSFYAPPFYSEPLVDVLPPCATPCGPAELACPTSHTCWSSAQDQCLYCLGGAGDLCACWGGDAPLPDGYACQYFAGDAIINGNCRAGVCLR